MYAGEGNGPIFNELTDMMDFHMDVLNVRVANVVLGQATHSVIVTQKRGGSGGCKPEADEEFAEEGNFV